MTASLQSDIFEAAQQVVPEILENGQAESFNKLDTSDFIDVMLAQHRQRELAIEQTKQFIDKSLDLGVMNYFIDGMHLLYGHEVRASLPTDLSSAKAALRVESWMRLLNESKIFDLMPADQRKTARAQFSGLECPPFDESTVRPTMQDLMARRAGFFAERVDGIFRSLSRSHVTNQPSGFSKKMIINNVFDKFGTIEIYKPAVISDLRGVVGRLTGRGEPSEYGTRKLLARLYGNHIGKKVAIDGGALYITVYRVGTCHLEVAPEIAAELNAVLAQLYPQAIPSRFRTPPKKKSVHSYDLKSERLPMDVIDLLSTMEFRGTNRGSTSTYSQDKETVTKLANLLESVGATCLKGSDMLYADFDFPPYEVIEQIMFSGVVPEQVSYQFYATKGEIADDAAQRLDVKPGMTCCEPSAGTGELAAHLPMDSTLCIELAKIRAKVLKAKGYDTVEADFLDWSAQNQNIRFDRVLMNPPFSKGRAKAHLEAAASHLKVDGRLVAILPASMINTAPLDGFDHDWSDVYVDQFEGTHVRVAILTATPA